ncbi:MAG TPA: PAS domain S-box protein, partial [Bacteroidales bacterium]|nr:PAS domain S-box protein [Bacteroidales bacterium]
MKRLINYNTIIVIIGLLVAGSMVFAYKRIRDNFSLHQLSSSDQMEINIREIGEVLNGSLVFRLYLTKNSLAEDAIRNRIMDYFEDLRLTYRLQSIGLYSQHGDTVIEHFIASDKQIPGLTSWALKLNKSQDRPNDAELIISESSGQTNYTAIRIGGIESYEPFFLAIERVDNKKGRIATPFDGALRTIVLLMIIVLLAAVITLFIVKRSGKRSIFYIESVSILLLGLLFGLFIQTTTEIRSHQESEKIFTGFSQSKLQNLRIILNAIRLDLALIEAFFESSETVTQEELETFTFSLFSQNPYYNAVIILRADFSDDTASKHFKGPLEPVLATYRGHWNEFQQEVILSSQHLRDITIEANRTGLYYLAKYYDKTGKSNLENFFVYFQPVLGGRSEASTGNRHFLCVFINPQELLTAAMNEANLINPLIPASLAVGRQSQPDSLVILASFPNQHSLLHKQLSSIEHLDEYTYSSMSPIFFGGETLYFITHSSDEFVQAVEENYDKNALVLITLLSIVFSFLVFYLRTGWMRLELAVARRTDQLNRRVNELEILSGLSTALKQENIQEALLWLCKRYNTDASLRKDSLLLIHYEGAPICEESEADAGRLHRVIRKDLLNQERVIGCLEILSFLNENERHTDDRSELFLDQLQFSINSWMAFLNASKELSEVEERFSKLMESSFDGIYMLQDDHFIWVNKAFADMLEYDPAELTSPDFNAQRLLTPASIKIGDERKAMRERGEKPPSRFDFQQRTKSGKIKDVELSLVTVQMASQKIIFGIVREVTEQRAIERALRDSEERLQQQNEELQLLNEELTSSNNHLRELNLALSEAHRRAEAGDKLKTAFLNNISHEVRTPLNGICGASEILANPDLSISERLEMTEILNMSTKRLLRTITQ